MAIKRTFNGATIIKPGAYTKIVVENLTGFPLQPTGTVGVIGEAIGGEPRVLDIVSGTGIQDAKARYKSGPIADALELLVNPGNDVRIPNGASKIVIYKTNDSTQAASAFKSNIGAIDLMNLLTKNYGADEDQVAVDVSAGSVPTSNALLLGSIAETFNLTATGDTLVVRINGNLYTYTSTLSGAAETAAAIKADMEIGGNWAPAGVPVDIVEDTGKLNLAYNSTLVPEITDSEYSHMEIDAASTLDIILGLSGDSRGAKGSKIFTVTKGDLEEISPDLGGFPLIKLRYIGATPDGVTADIKVVGTELKLTTVVSGNAAEQLDIILKDANGLKHTLKTLVNQINAAWVGVYEASVVGNNPSLNADLLDHYIGMPLAGLSLATGGTFYGDNNDVLTYFNNASTLVSATVIDNVVGAIAVDLYAFTGGADGSSTNQDWADGFEAFKEERLNIVVPLISKDIGALTIDSINALGLNHAKWGWSTVGRSERHVFESKQGSKDEFKDASRAINSAYVSMVGQQPRVLNRVSELVYLDEWGYACIAAGMRAGAEVGEPLTAKIMNVNDLRVLDGSWNPKKDFEEMIDAGCWIGEALDTGGFRHVVGNTTYGVDPNFVWNRESVVQASGFVAYDLRFNLDLVFTGTKAKTGTAEALANFIKNRMSTYLAADIIVGDDLNEGIGYKNLRVEVEGNTAIINISITPVQGLDFILPTIYLADIRQSA